MTDTLQTPLPCAIASQPPRKAKTRDEAIRILTAYLAGKHLRMTHSRQAILDAVLSYDGHFTVEDLLVKFYSADSLLARATIYRSLPILVECGLLREVDVGRDKKYYIHTLSKDTFQAQLICEDCDKIIETSAPFMEWFGKTVSEKYGMELVSQRLQIGVRCKSETCPRHAKQRLAAAQAAT